MERFFEKFPLISSLSCVVWDNNPHDVADRLLRALRLRDVSPDSKHFIQDVQEVFVGSLVPRKSEQTATSKITTAKNGARIVVDKRSLWQRKALKGSRLRLLIWGVLAAFLVVEKLVVKVFTTSFSATTARTRGRSKTSARGSEPVGLNPIPLK